MAERPERRPREATAAQVRTVEWITPHMIRVVLGGPGLAGFSVGEFTDHYIKVIFPEENADPGARPRSRTYTVRRFDPAAGELTVDLFHHGDVGLAGPWAAALRPGDEVRFLGPGGAYAPAADADWYLLAGDESALPAIAASLERVPAGALVHAYVEVAGPEEEQKLNTPGDLRLTWLHRGDAAPGERLVQAVTGLALPEGTADAFVHGEAGTVKQLRRLLLVERGIPRDRLSISGYWRLGHDDEQWRAVKRDFTSEMEAQQQTP